MPDVFQHGVASGDPLADRVILWTRTEGPHKLRWVVAEDPALERVVASGEGATSAEADFTFKVDATGLAPARDYFYAFETGTERSPVGRTRTLPHGPTEHVRLAVYSCAKYSAGYFNGYARIAERDLDFVVCLGDYIYEYGNNEKGLGAKIGRAFEPDHECRSLDDYRTRYKQYRRDPDVQALHLRHPLIAIVDDHEMCNDTWREGAGKHDPATDGPWEERKESALQAWREWLPVRVGYKEPIYRAFRVGDLFDLVLLDTRTQRDKQAAPPEADREDRTLLGREQFEWLTERLRTSETRWRLIGNGVLICQVDSGFNAPEIDDELSELGVLTKREYGPEPDQWDGYPAERRRLLTDVRRNAVRNTVFLSGDVHSSWAADLKLDPHDEEEDSIGVEFATTSMTSENLDDEMGWEPRTRSIEVEDEIVKDNPHIYFAEFDSHGYMTLDVTPQRVRTEWWYVEGIPERVDGERLGASWEVADGAHTVREAKD